MVEVHAFPGTSYAYLGIIVSGLIKAGIYSNNVVSNVNLLLGFNGYRRVGRIFPPILFVTRRRITG